MGNIENCRGKKCVLFAHSRMSGRTKAQATYMGRSGCHYNLIYKNGEAESIHKGQPCRHPDVWGGKRIEHRRQESQLAEI